jgi:hypothetical protein
MEKSSDAYHRVANARNLAESKPWTDQQHPFDAVSLVGAETLGAVAGQPRYDVQIVDFCLEKHTKYEFDVNYCYQGRATHGRERLMKF